jgi:hypothetical protein
MSVEQLTERVGQLTDRHTFLRKAGVATVGALAGVMGVPASAGALYNYHCCNLCNPNDSNCANRSAVVSCWGWNCCYAGVHHHCWECYGSGTPCTGGCSGTVCSYVKHPGSPCHAGTGGSCRSV